MSRILVIDDDKLVRNSLRQVLEKAGYEVVVAPNGKVGVDIFRKEPTDLVITDILMPEKEGLETISELSRVAPKPKILAISGGGPTGPDEYLRVAKRYGAHQIMEKPMESAELLSMVKQLLEEDKC